VCLSDSLAFISLRFNPVFNFSFELRPVLFSSSSASFRGSHSLKNEFLLSPLTYALLISFKFSSGRSFSILSGYSIISSFFSRVYHFLLLGISLFMLSQDIKCLIFDIKNYKLSLTRKSREL